MPSMSPPPTAATSTTVARPLPPARRSCAKSRWCSNPAECQSLIDAADASGGYLMEGMWTWFLPAVRRALDWYRAGRIGELLHLKSDFGYPLEYGERVREYDARLGGGAVLEMGIYPVAIARLFIGRGPERIQVSGRRAPNGVEDDMVAICDYGDCTATLATSFRCKLPNWTYLVGTEGTIAIPDFWCARRCLLYRLDQLVDEFDDGRSTGGFDYEIEAASREIAAGATESATYRWQPAWRCRRTWRRCAGLSREALDHRAIGARSPAATLPRIGCRRQHRRSTQATHVPRPPDWFRSDSACCDTRRYR